MILQPFTFISGSASGGGCAPITNTTSAIITTGNSSSTTAFISNYWKMSFAMMVITQAELGTAKQITALEFNNTASGSIAWTHPSVVIKIAHCTGTSFSAANFAGTFPNQEIVGISGITDETEVYNNSYNLTSGTGYKTINLSTNFCYNGTDNIVISMSKGLQSGGNCSVYAPGCGYTFDDATWEYKNDGSGSNTGVFYDSDITTPTGINSTGSGSNGDINNFRALIKVKH